MSSCRQFGMKLKRACNANNLFIIPMTILIVKQDRQFSYQPTLQARFNFIANWLITKLPVLLYY